MANITWPYMDAPGDANTGSMRFSTIYPTSLVGSMTCAMMLSGPCILITTPVFDYPSQLQAVTGMVAHWQGCRPPGVQTSRGNSHDFLAHACQQYLTAFSVSIGLW